MIRYPVTLKQLETLVEAESPGWLADAAKRTAAFKKKKAYDEASGNWSAIKRVYMRLQHSKCAYCERKLEDERFGTIEHDVEHFRPKSSIKEWPTAQQSSARGIALTFPTGAASSKGYYLLAYHVLNYSTSCKTCNTPLKGNAFPVAGARKLTAAAPKLAKSEQPLLVYPIGSDDADPATILTFDGLKPSPVAAPNTHEFRRAQVIIDFFELDTRETLLRERAERIQMLWIASIVEANGTAAQRASATRQIARLVAPSAPHSACVAAFKALMASAPAKATQLHDAIETYLDEQS